MNYNRMICDDVVVEKARAGLSLWGWLREIVHQVNSTPV